GAGGMGVVYEALDRERSTRIALKALRTLDAEAILLFKNEFRALCDLHHPNLITLGELIEADGQWFFTMELVRGTNFLEYVRPSGEYASNAQTSDETRNEKRRTNGEEPALPTISPGSAPAAFDEARLRSCLAQLVMGLLALHATNNVHRDIKPSN